MPIFKLGEYKFIDWSEGSDQVYFTDGDHEITVPVKELQNLMYLIQKYEQDREEKIPYIPHKDSLRPYKNPFTYDPLEWPKKK